MSDSNRKNFSNKFSETVTPNSQKSTVDKAKEGLTDAYDKTASNLQPEEEKGMFQKISDSITGKKA